MFSRCFIMLGLPLIAWGLDDLAGFFSNPVRVAIAMIVLVLASAQAWMVYAAPQQPKEAKAEARSTRLRLKWHGTLFEIIIILAAYGDRRDILTWNENQLLRWVGLGIYLLGAILSIWAGLTWVNHLRREGASAVDNAVLLREGPYRSIRYPTLLCLLFFSLGFAIAFRSWIGLALLVPLIAVVVNRTGKLDRGFAEKYRVAWPLRSYRSKRIIPFLY